MGPKRRQSTPEDLARAAEIRRAYDEKYPEGTDLERQPRPGIRGNVVETEQAGRDEPGE